MKGPQAIKVQLGDLRRRTENSSTAADNVFDHGGREDIGEWRMYVFPQTVTDNIEIKLVEPF